MTRHVAALLSLLLLAGCATQKAPEQSTTAPPSSTAPTSTPSAPAADVKAAVPRKEEVCLKPEDTSGITIQLYKPAGDSTFRARPGWTIARPNMALVGAVVFPKPVDRASVKLSVEPASYQPVETKSNAPDTIYDFKFLQDGKEYDLKPGWITLKVESARAKDGTVLVGSPLALKIFAYDNAMADANPYLHQCYTSLGVAPGGNGP